MHNIKYGLLLLVCLFLTSADVMAVDATLFPTTNYNCKLPVTREDGSAFNYATEGSQVMVYWGTAPGKYNNSVPLKVCQWVIDNTAFPDGTTLYIVATVTDNGKRESLYSPVYVHNITVSPVPKPITAPAAPGLLPPVNIPVVKTMARPR